jgi:hypothetical protein
MGEQQAADSVTAGGLGEHQLDPGPPAGELEELRRPHHRPLGGLDPVAEDRMAGVDHRPGVDPQLGPLVGDQPGIQRPGRGVAGRVRRPTPRVTSRIQAAYRRSCGLA